MKRLFATVALAVLLLSSIGLQSVSGTSSPSVAWKELGPAFGSIYTIAVDPFSPNVVLGGSYFGGLFRSTDYGNNGTWQRVSGITDSGVMSVTANPSISGTFYASTQSGGIFVSHDDGATWVKSSVCPDGAQKYVVDQLDPSNQFAVCASGFWTSQNGGVTWSRPSLALNPQVSDIQVSPSSGTVYILGDAGSSLVLSKSSNGGLTWSAQVVDAPGFQYQENSPQSLAVDPTNNSIMLVAGQGGTIRTQDGGKTWQDSTYSNSSLLPDTVHGDEQGFVAFQDSGIAYAGRTYLWKSVDSGSTFQLVTKFESSNGGATVATPHTDEGGIAFDNPAGRIYVGTDGGLWVSTDNGTTWGSAAEGMQNGLVTSVAIDPYQSGTIALTRQDWPAMVSNDNGTTWHAVASDAQSELTSENGVVTFDPARPGVFYLANAQCGGYSGVEKSTDHGVTWHLLSNGTDGLPQSLTGGIGTNLALDPTNTSTVWVAYFQGVFKSTDGGNHWTKVFNLNATNIAVNGNYVYVNAIAWNGYSYTYSLWESRDGGLTWNESSLVSEPTPVAVAIDSTAPTTVYVAANATLYASADAGGTFQSLSTPKKVFPITRYGLQSAGVILVQDVSGSTRITLASLDMCINCGGTARIYESFDGGGTWSDITGNLNVTNVRQIVADPLNPDRLYLATWGEGVVTGILPSTAPTTTTSTTALTTSSSASAKTTSTVAATTTTTSSAASATSPTMSSTTSATSSSGGGGIPEFPYQLLAMTVFVVMILLGYLVNQRRQHVPPARR